MLDFFWFFVGRDVFNFLVWYGEIIFLFEIDGYEIGKLMFWIFCVRIGNFLFLDDCVSWRVEVWGLEYYMVDGG